MTSARTAVLPGTVVGITWTQVTTQARKRVSIVVPLISHIQYVYKLDNERECSMGYSVPRVDRRPRGPKARVDFYLCEGHYIPLDTSVHYLTDLEYDHIPTKNCVEECIFYSLAYFIFCSHFAINYLAVRTKLIFNYPSPLHAASVFSSFKSWNHLIYVVALSCPHPLLGKTFYNIYKVHAYSL